MASLGGAIGVVAGGIFGWMAGSGSISLPGTGLLIASGPLLGMLSAAGVIGILSRLIDGLIDLGICEFEAKRYADYLERGEILLCVVAEMCRERNLVKDVFRTHQVQQMGHSPLNRAD